MDTAQYNAIMGPLRMLGTRLGNLGTRAGNLGTRVGGLEKEMCASHQNTIRWVMGLLVAALLVNGPVIGAIVSVIILKTV